MRKIRFGLVEFVIFVALGGAVPAQNLTSDPAAQPPPAPAHLQFFAGTVVELDAVHIRVTRSLVGRPTESRSFAINAATKMSKAAIKLHSRVTVRYKRAVEGDLALEIQPRPVTARTPKG